MKRYTPFALLMLLVSGFALAQMDENEFCWCAWDADEDGFLSETEFMDGYYEFGRYDDWDADSDGLIDEDEFGEGLYDYYDENDDGDLTNEEFDIGDDRGDAGFWDV